MKNVQISDELYENLKDFVVDPFDDTPEAVLSRVVDIAGKARSRCSPLDFGVTDKQQKNEGERQADEPLVSL
ncbi:MAG: hypothetical protein AMJ79_07570 [Phycisphaerae bacterium SM23_30]|nr:MAG: hypothetical protein AMJ79_07570 [Phycisphaerae bacterium SM23_30]